jgi:YegS/Rv2252/BmrU family lipid kinase
MHKAFIVYNPKAGNSEQSEAFHSVLERHFASPQWSFEIYEITGKENLASVCQSAYEKGATHVVSAGGDGTLVSVANALIHRKIPLGILPLGTGNLLSKILNIPQKLDDAVQLIVGDHQLIDIDALKVGERYFLSNISVGISPVIMDETSSSQKKRFGMLAYIWTGIKRSSLFNLHRYILTIDDHPRRVVAAEILISNTPFFEKATTLYGPPETLHDGKFEVYLATAQKFPDYLRLTWDLLRGPGRPGAKLYHWESHYDIRIESTRAPRLVQGDGEVIGHTPIDVRVVPKAIQVIMPKPDGA